MKPQVKNAISTLPARFINFSFLTLLLLAVSCLNTFAGDYATRNIIGFSNDGNLFALEEYGIQDGSGFAYANIYLINTQNDSWTGGSPWRAFIEEDSINAKASIAKARNQARQLAANKLGAITQTGFIAATNRHTEIAEKPLSFKAHPRHFVPSSDQTIEFELEIKDVHQANAPTNHCSGITNIKGFNLYQIIDNQKVALHIDGPKIPKSRNCPLNYKFADIITYYPANDTPKFAVLLLIESFGFEGPDGRYLAITAPIQPQ
ncbi:MAG: DUF2259 domain-containing protein [Nitratireductor sp.]